MITATGIRRSLQKAKSAPPGGIPAPLPPGKIKGSAVPPPPPTHSALFDDFSSSPPLPSMKLEERSFPLLDLRI